MSSIFQSAIDNWPEDEATLEAESFNDYRLDDTPDEEARRLDKLRAHWVHVFDDAATMARFVKRFNELSEGGKL
jgi:hypothetical protein